MFHINSDVRDGQGLAVSGKNEVSHIHSDVPDGQRLAVSGSVSLRV